MTECDFCTLIKGKKNKIYEDEQIFVMHAQKPATFGHIIVLPKKHYMIIEQVPDFEVAEIFAKINKISIAIFEGVGAQGTNIMLQNGVAAGQQSSHLMIHIIPRRENDGIGLMWPPKQMSEEEMSTIELKLKEAAKDIGAFEKEPPKPIVMKKDVEEIKQAPEGEEENYMIKQLERIP